MSAKERRKGHNFERLVAKVLRPIWPDSIRILEYQQGRGHDVEAGPFRIQCKKCKQYVSVNRIREVKEKVPMLVTAGDHKRPVVVMYLKDFVDLMEGKNNAG